ncbi:hypothetical protein L3X38_027192 [Prunus dulcis]|uniref:Uncharacterized protein n=1 Tax=Prunus dulcis TaxID=3755 RepID=A0AAD4VPQ9_PRUDU|nr:hypothetical protein L3X38_027192 [Prunus dulcis]
MASSIEAGGSWTNVRRGQNLGDEIIQGKTKKMKTITHGYSSEQYPQSVPVVHFASEIMALLRPPKENTPRRRDPVEPPPSMIESSLYSIVSDYKDREYFNYMMSGLHLLIVCVQIWIMFFPYEFRVV